MTAPAAVSIMGMLPRKLISALVLFLAFFAFGRIRKERFSRIFSWNLLPLLTVYPMVALSFSIWWEQENRIVILDSTVWLYVAASVAPIFIVRKAPFLSLAAQALIFIYASGEYFLCAMAITGKWL
jgi:hypothetical protein